MLTKLFALIVDMRIMNYCVFETFRRFGDIAELIFSEILENSQIELHKLVQKVINKTKPTGMP